MPSLSNNLPPLLAPEAPVQASKEFRLRRILYLVLLLMAALALIPFHPEDIDFYAGGICGSTYPYNTLGAVGAHFAWFCLMTLGLAAYPLLAMAGLCCLRRLVWREKLLSSSWEYFLAILLFGIGIALLLGSWPQLFPALTARLNIHTIPGGVIGKFFCEPSRGILYRLLAQTGCMVISLTIIVISSGVIWHYDWQMPFLKLWEAFLLRRKEAREAAQAAAYELPEMQPPVPPAPQMTMPQTPPPSPQPRAVPEPQMPPAVPSQPVPEPQASLASSATQPDYGVFCTRRGQASLDAARMTAEAIQGPPHPQPAAPAPLRQPELPVPPAPAVPVSAPPSPPQQPLQTAASLAGAYHIPVPLSFYQPSQSEKQALANAREIEESKSVLQKTLDDFNMDAEVVNAIPGPQVTLYEIQMGSGVALSKLGSLQENLSMALKARRAIRMLLPIPGKDRAGIEVPNRVRQTVCAHELFSSEAWANTRMHLPLMLGKNISGDVCMLDLQKAPHLLIAGATGSGKSVCMNLMIQSMLLRFPPDKLRLIMFDPKFLEFAPYGKIPHLISPIINEPNQVGLVLNWACREMDKRYKQLAAVNVRQLSEFNSRPPSSVPIEDADGDVVPDTLPYLVIIVDELADIMAQAKKEVEQAMARLAGKARAAGIHMIVATQRPSSDVITGVIKSNFPQRIALQVTDQINSRVILDTKGAENLLGQGDMLYSTGAADSERIQCGWLTNAEIAAVADACASQTEQHFDESLMRALESRNQEGDPGPAGTADADTADFSGEDGDSMDGLVRKALTALEQIRRPTISALQRQLRIGYNKSADLMDELQRRGYVGPQPISGMREIYWDNFPGHGGAAFGDSQPEDDSLEESAGGDSGSDATSS